MTNLADEKPKVGPLFIGAFALAMTAVWIGILTPLIVTLPLRVREIVPPGQEAGALSLMLGVGAFIAMIANPIFGKLSDATKGPLGRRRPWLIAGQVGQVISVVVLLQAQTVPVLFAGWCLMQLSINAYFAAIYPVLSDQVPTSQRGLVSGLIGVTLPIGQLGGTALAAMFSPDMVAMFAAPTVASVVLSLPLLFLLREGKAPAAAAVAREPINPVAWVRSFWIDPRSAPDFAWTWASRFLFILGLSFVLTFQAYYVINHLKVPADLAPDVIFKATWWSTVPLVIASTVGGYLSDLAKRRKMFVAAAAAIYAVGLWLIAASPDVSFFFIAMAVAGLGQGLYLAVDLALVTDVLPNPDDAAKDLGLFNVANTLPQSLAPSIAPSILAIGGGSYAALFLGAGLFAFLGTLAIVPVKGVR